jgi:hypothetical protein
MITDSGSDQDDPGYDAVAPARGLLCAVALSSAFWVMLALMLHAA